MFVVVSLVTTYWELAPVHHCNWQLKSIRKYLSSVFKIICHYNVPPVRPCLLGTVAHNWWVVHQQSYSKISQGSVATNLFCTLLETWLTYYQAYGSFLINLRGKQNPRIQMHSTHLARMTGLPQCVRRYQWSHRTRQTKPSNSCSALHYSAQPLTLNDCGHLVSFWL